ncbi:MAG TPA: TylF/MycF/NovP-related O-methyltransferase [Bacteroidota bacterium]|jgi:hypothetical protein|nr:TylF/MycF/NovP-related O-methyltransferase [Bacteroidota bacterium]
MERFAKQFIKWLAFSKALSYPRSIFRRLVTDAISNKHGVIVYYNAPHQSKAFDLIDKIKSETEMLLTNNEAYQIFMAVTRTEKVKGDVAEVGVYKGGSAKLICEAKGDKALHLFDTFEGIPKIEQIDASRFYKGQYAASIDAVRMYLEKYTDVYFYKGLFPATAEPIKDKKFSFVNLDVDTYESTLNCLTFFYTRMSQCGVIISHDYISADGVRKAFDEFFRDKPEPILELSGSHCLIVKS